MRVSKFVLRVVHTWFYCFLLSNPTAISLLFSTSDCPDDFAYVDQSSEVLGITFHL